VEELCDKLGHPQRKIKVIHIAGTKGKGSTAAILTAIFKAAGFKTGLFISPHLVDLRERIRINDQLISEEELTELVDTIKPHTDRIQALGAFGELTYFELLTVLAFCYFAEKQVDITILEVGLGGRFDATNVIEPLVSVITPISLDHTDILGGTIESIAEEKAQIIKKGNKAVIAPQPPEAMAVLRRRCEEMQAEFCPCKEIISTTIHRISNIGCLFSLHSPVKHYDNLWLPLLGRHQVENTATAIAAIEQLPPEIGDISYQAVRQGLAELSWPGRVQIVERRPYLVLDGAHNVDSIRVLRETLKEVLSFRRAIVVIGIAADKDIAGIVRELFPFAEEFIITRAKTGRFETRDRIETELRGSGKKVVVTDDLPTAIARARADALPEECIVVTGSFYLVGEAMEYLGIA
ncbi:MAG: bifunctional folylpolyglutamate synthase/dihydrofolate synthase, partial [Deltaproteobacteria bacterium]